MIFKSVTHYTQTDTQTDRQTAVYRVAQQPKNTGAFQIFIM